MYQVPRKRIVRHQQIHRQRNQSNHNHQHRPCNDCQRNVNLRTEVALHHHVIQVQYQLHQVANRAPVVLHQPVKRISGINNTPAQKYLNKIIFEFVNACKQFNLSVDKVKIRWRTEQNLI